MKTFDKKVKWEFKAKICGRGKTMQEAYKDALRKELNDFEDYDEDTLEGIYSDEVDFIDEHDFEEEE